MKSTTISKKNKDQKKTKLINFRATEKEYHKIKENAQSDNKTISEYMIKKSLKKELKNTEAMTLCINMAASVQELLNHINSMYGFDEYMDSVTDKIWKTIESEVDIK